MRDNSRETTAKDPLSESRASAPEEIFADPVAYLERFGIEAQLIEPAPAALAPAA